MNPSPIRLLLVEDNPPDALLLKQALAEADEGAFQVTHAELMAEAVRHLGRKPFDAVLLDLSLPDSCGIATVEQASAAAPGVPIVVMTGLEDEATALEAVRKGAQDFLIKGRTDGWLLTRALRYALERKQAEQELKAAQAEALSEANRLKAVMEVLPMGVAILDRRGGNIRCNPMFEQIWGAPRPATRSVSDYAKYKASWVDTGKPLRPEEWASARALREGKAVVGQIVEIERFDGTRAFVSNSAAPILDAQGNVVGSAVAIMDITDRVRAEEALRRLNEALEQRVVERTAVATRRAAQLQVLASELTRTEQRERRRLAQVLHDDLQQLLYAARLNLGTLQSRLPKDSAQELIGRIDELLSQSIARSRSLTVQLSPPVLYEAGLSAALEWLGRHMQETVGLTVEVEAAPEVEPESEDLRILLFQAARELLFNVTKHAGTNRARVAVAAAANGEIRLAVSDEGSGFDPAEPKAEQTAGVGFGLFSIRERLELLGGRMKVDTAPGRGTRVTILAPRRRSERILNESQEGRVAATVAGPVGERFP